MTQQEFFKEWSGKYPKCFDELKKYLQNHYVDYFYYDENEYQYEIRLECLNEICKFEMLFGIINKFFREYDILFVAPTYSEFGWGFDIMDILENERFNDYMEHRIENPEKTIMLAILKSAEILENIL